MAVTAHTSPYTGDQNNDWALETYHFGPLSVGIASGTIVLGADAAYPLITFQEKVTIEKISMRLTTLAAADADTIQFGVAASGTAIGSATAITAAEPLTTNGNAALAAATTVDIPFSGTAHKNLASGTTLALITGGTIVSAAGLTISVTVRKAPNRVNDAGTNFYTKN